ncbi:AAA family ATPase [Aeromonas veronii]|uniref:AAA family ATPase n=1 Tax=Aeromonas veronii TaxID=654 RepID=UPI003BA03FBA
MELRFLAFTGPNKETASVSFGPGLNIIYGPSNTGKSSIVDAIDFMFGRDRKLKEKPEHQGYDQIALGLSFSENDKFTLIRNIQGGDIQCISGLHTSIPSKHDVEILKITKPTKKHRTISKFLFEKIGIGEKKLKTNAKNNLASLTIRNSIQLALITESEIQKEGSPYLHKGFTKVTEELSRLKLFLTGIDDSSLLPSENEKTLVSKNAKIDLLNELIDEIKNELKKTLNKHQTYEQLKSQKEKLDINIHNRLSSLTEIENEFEQNSNKIKKTSNAIDKGEHRLNEVRVMIERFNLLDKQYSSDISRLENISEVGTLFIALPDDNCPLCGATPSDEKEHDICEGDIDKLVESATAEKTKLLKLKNELTSTLKNLTFDADFLYKNQQRLTAKLEALKSKASTLNDIINKNRHDYKDIIELKDFIVKSLRLYEQQFSFEERISKIASTNNSVTSVVNSESTIPEDSLYKLSTTIKDILNEWNFIMPDNVYFDITDNDFVFDGKQRGSNGKGFRALTHAACSLGLMKYQEKYESLPHFGFVLLDSPLLAYEEPDNTDDDLSKTDINVNFFNHLSKWKNRQIIVIENKKSIPIEFSKGAQITKFTGIDVGKYGFFPINNR